MIELRRRAGAPVLRIGHRGAAALAPENTLRSLRAAVEAGVDFVELDAFDLADGTLVLAHSNDLFEVSHGAATGAVRARTLDELLELAPDLPTLDEALAFFAEQSSVGVHVDVKCEGREDALAGTIRRHGLVERTLVSSFSARSRSLIVQAKTAAPWA